MIIPEFSRNFSPDGNTFYYFFVTIAVTGFCGAGEIGGSDPRIPS